MIWFMIVRTKAPKEVGQVIHKALEQYAQGSEGSPDRATLIAGHLADQMEQKETIK